MLRRTPLRRGAPLRRGTKPLARHVAVRKRAPRRSTRTEDVEYREWILQEPSIVSAVHANRIRPGILEEAWSLIGDRNRLLETVSGIEAHHHIGGNDHTVVPLYWWLHRETSVSIHGGGGRRKFAQRFNIDWDAEIARLREQYERETGRKAT